MQAEGHGRTTFQVQTDRHIELDKQSGGRFQVDCCVMCGSGSRCAESGLAPTMERIGSSETT